MLTDKNKHVHCIGIGGIGVSALAEVLLSQGYRVTGSDIAFNANTARLTQLGAKIALGHNEGNIANPEWVIYSSAICPENPELIAAKKQSIPLLPRGEFLPKLMKDYRVITVAGTHGKTTTTGMISHLLFSAGKDPSYVIGGILQNHTSPVRIGKGEYCVVEVDESDASFLHMHSCYGIVTNIDIDHLEAYGGCFEKLKQSFLDYLSRIPSQGAAIVCIDDPIIRGLLPSIKCRVITYGFSEHADVRACFFHQKGMFCEFSVRFHDEQECLSLQLNLPGQHNVLNALASIALAKEVGVEYPEISKAMKSFPGVGRRFHAHGNMRLTKGSALVFEDYGHHPREIKATIEAAKLAWPDRRLVLVFQPHRYTRTRDLYQDFVEVLKEADKLYLVDVFGAGEQPLENISSVKLAEEIGELSKNKPDYVSDLASLPGILHDSLHDQDVVILQGAGSIGAITKELPLEE